MQQNIEYNKIIEIIRTDNEAEFFDTIKTNAQKSVAFGRFCLLSLCYIYNAKRILKVHEERLLKIEEYNRLEYEPQDACVTMRQNAGIYIRHLYQMQVINPLIVLAVLNKIGRLKKLLIGRELSGEDTGLIIKIAAKKRGAASIDEHGVLTAPRQKLKRVHKMLMSAAAIMLAIIIATPITITHAINLRGRGTADSPFRIRTHQELIYAASQEDIYFILHNDIVLPQNHEIDYFKAHLNGGGHTVSSPHGSMLAHTLEGSLQSIRFNSPLASHLVFYNRGDITSINFYAGTPLNRASIVIDQYTGVIEEGMIGGVGILTQINSGTISNINMTAFIDLNASFSRPYYECFVGLIASQNWGIIQNSSINGNVVFNSDGTEHVYFGSIAGRNLYMIRNNEVREGFNFRGSYVHVGGLIGFSDGLARVFNNRVFGDFEQLSGQNFLKFVGGIVAVELGETRSDYTIIRGNIVGGRFGITRTGDMGGFVFFGGIAGDGWGGLIENNIIRTRLVSNMAPPDLEGNGMGLSVGWIIGLAAVFEFMGVPVIVADIRQNEILSDFGEWYIGPLQRIEG